MRAKRTKAIAVLCVAVTAHAEEDRKIVQTGDLEDGPPAGVGDRQEIRLRPGGLQGLG